MLNTLHAFDASVVISLNNVLNALPFLGQLVSYIAYFGVYIVPIAWLIWWFVASKKERLSLFSSLCSGLLGWQVINRLIKLFYFKERPLQGLELKEVFFERPENSFPSDHSAFLAGIAFYYFLAGEKKSGAWLIVLALVVCGARVAVGFHYPSDILGGFLVGFISAWITRSLHPWLTEVLWQPLLRLAERLRLA